MYFSSVLSCLTCQCYQASVALSDMILFTFHQESLVDLSVQCMLSVDIICVGPCTVTTATCVLFVLLLQSQNILSTQCGTRLF